MKKAVVKEIMHKASLLPIFKVPGPEVEVFRGIDLLRKGVTSMNNVIVNPDKVYRIAKLVDINHYGICKDIFRKEGMDGVDEYFNKIMAHFEDQRKQIEYARKN